MSSFPSCNDAPVGAVCALCRSRGCGHSPPLRPCSCSRASQPWTHGSIAAARGVYRGCCPEGAAAAAEEEGRESGVAVEYG